MEHKYLVPILVSKMTWVIDLISLVQCPEEPGAAIFSAFMLQLCCRQPPKKSFFHGNLCICTYCWPCPAIISKKEEKKSWEQHPAFWKGFDPCKHSSSSYADLGIVSAQKRENALCVGHQFMLTGAPPSKLLFLLAPSKYIFQVQC